MIEQTDSLREALEQRIGYRFKTPDLLLQALTHRSFANESRDPAIADNERLEFLGDAVLDLAVSRILYAAYDEADEGELSRMRAELVNAPTLARLAGELALGECLLLGRGEERSGGRDKDNLLADSLEAVIGAVFLDAGYDAAHKVVADLFGPLLAVGIAPAAQDYKSRLQESLQSLHRERPEYNLVAAHGPAHQRSYEVEILVDGVVLGKGAGPTKKRAEQEAAREAIAVLAARGGRNDD